MKVKTLMVVLALLLGAGAFWDGLYSPAQHLVATAALAVAFLGQRSEEVLARSEVIACALLLAGVGVSLSGSPVMGNAAHGPLVVVGWLLALLAGRRLAREGVLERVLGRIWAFTGPLMLFGGMGGISYLPEHHSGRLAAFLGYPIALGVLGMLGAAGALPLVSGGERRWWPPVLLSANLAAVLLSGSRGVWAVSLLLALYLLRTAPGLLRRTRLPLLGALATALWSGPAVAARAPAPALLTALVACLAVAAAEAGAFQHRPWLRRLAAAGLAAAAALAPGWGWLLGRAAALPMTEGSSVERLTFLRDGLRLMLEHPGGAGYRAWTALQLQGASYAYYSAEAHSVLVDLGLAFGWAGAAAYLIFLGRLLWSLRAGSAWSPERLAVLAALGALGLHALLDWDLSYAIFAIPLWTGFGLAGVRPGATALRLPPPLPAGLAALALAGSAVLGAGDGFAAAAREALADGAPARAAPHASMAVALTPWSDTAHAVLGQAQSASGQRDAALDSFARARALGRLEPWYAELQARELASAGPGRWRESATAYQELVALWPWHVPAYEAALEALLDLTMRAALQGDDALAADLARTGKEVLAMLDRQKAKEPASTPRLPMQTETATLKKARLYFTPRPPA